MLGFTAKRYYECPTQALNENRTLSSIFNGGAFVTVLLCLSVLAMCLVGFQ